MSGAKPTPMMAQYLQLKEEYKDHILFYRLGDFYELFFEDALQAAPILDIALTKRGQHEGEPIPMCGVPAHAYENYLVRLIKAGLSVAICEQVETPEQAKKRGSSAIVRRDVVRIITPGTLTETSLLEQSTPNYLMAINARDKEAALAVVDISTGSFFVEHVAVKTLESSISKYAPKETLYPDKLHEKIGPALKEMRIKCVPQTGTQFSNMNAVDKLKEFYGVGSIESFGAYSALALGAIKALLEYILLTQKGLTPKLKPPRMVNKQHVMEMDRSTRQNLEIMTSIRGEREGSLFALMHKTVSPLGARMLVEYMISPLVDKERLEQRHDMVAWAQANDGARQELREQLKQVHDIERALSRLHMNRASPRDMLLIRESLKALPGIAHILDAHGAPIRAALKKLMGFESLVELLDEALKDEVPVLARDGGFVREGYCAQLDEFQQIKEHSADYIKSLQQKYIDDTSIPSLKIKFNNILGYFIEVTATHAEKVPATFIHRQTLRNCGRYTTDELLTLQEKVLNAESSALTRELEIYDQLRMAILNVNAELLAAAEALAHIDVLVAFGDIAKTHNWCRPTLIDEPVLAIENGRHPVVEAHLRAKHETFVDNNTHLDENTKLYLITGPNMAGKSTYLRQNALIVFLAQIGAYVPATSATIGVTDRIFSRIGASDDLAGGQSTFMVEMIETASILNLATAKSLVILDEVGRGTSTYDGMSIAQATLEHLHNTNKCRGFFATHYHELTASKDYLNSLKCFKMQVKEWNGTIAFMHKLVEGIAESSYGLHVASLAGLPKNVVKRAQEILQTLEPSSGNSIQPPSQQQTSTEPLYEHILDVDIDDLSPREALDFLYKIREKIQK